MDNNLVIETLRVCRTCSEEIPNNIAFFDLDFTEVNTEATIGQKLCNCFPELDLSIIRNTIICGTCADIINFIYNFKRNCLRSELQIHKYIQRSQHTGDIDFAKVTQYNRNLSTELKTEDTEVTESFKYQETPTLLSNDTACNDGNDIESTNNEYLLSLQKVDSECVLFNTDDVFSHVLFNDSTNTGTEDNSNTYDNIQDGITQMVDNQNLGTTDVFYECYTCGHKTKSKSKLIWHLKSHTDKKIKNKRSSITVSKINKDGNGKCSSRSYSKQVLKSRSDLLQKESNLKKHMEVHTGDNPFACSVCEYKCNQKSRLKMHMLIHIGNKPFACSVCAYQCRVKNYLKKHMLIHTGNKPFACSVCEYKCNQKHNLKNHMLIHTGEKPFACSVCEYRCTRKSTLKGHMQIHTGEKRFTCSVCEYKAVQKCYLKNHMQMHTGEKPFTCSVCEYQCRWKSSLKKHMQIHTDDKPFSCSVCEYQCRQKSYLKTHMLIHTSDKPFTCSICEYQCRRKNKLKEHMQIHTGNKRFICSVCEYRCIRKGTLKRHMLIHIGNKPFACSVCEYQCRLKSDLKRHVQIHTGD